MNFRAMAVIKMTECVSKSILHLQGINFWFLVVLLGAGVVHSVPTDCEIVKKDFQTFGFSSTPLLDRPTTDSVCEAESCCGSGFENILYRKSHISLNRFLNESIAKVTNLIDARSRKFDEFFKEMMNKSRIEFHQMFERTYGKIYLQNSDVFGDFFNELETYYKKGSLRLSETMDNFFGILYQKMFTVLNTQYEFDDKYLGCVVEHMVEMKPFGDVPHKLSVQLRRSFVATRTFYKALAIGADVSQRMTALKLEENCAKDLIRMQYCGSCTGQKGEGICSGFCIHTIEKCLRHHVEFSDEWDKFVDAIEKVAERLLGPFNIEMVVEPLNIKISEAIMNFQESGTEVSEKIFKLCGKPELTRRKKRKAEFNNPPEDNRNYEIPYVPMKSHGRKKHKKGDNKYNNMPSLEKLIREIKIKIRDTRQFWSNLPYQYCNDIAASRAHDGICWNGTTIGYYTKPSQNFSALESALVNEQIFIIQGLTDKLRRAHQGEEVELVDDSEEPLMGSGSGSGGGSIEEEEDQDIIISRTNEDENVVPIDQEPREYPKAVTTTTYRPEVILNNQVNSASVGQVIQTMSLTRALTQYLIPIVLVWFGGAISDLL